MATTISRRKVPPKNVTIHSCHKRPAHRRAEYNPHRDALSLREARNGSNAANYAAKEPAGFKGSLWGLYSAPLCAALSAAMNLDFFVTIYGCRHAREIYSNCE